MRSDAQELRLLSARRSTNTAAQFGAHVVEALDEAFAGARSTDWRRDERHAEADPDLAEEVRSQLSALAEQSRELTRLLDKLNATGRGGVGRS